MNITTRTPLDNRRVLISGASIAGPALAYWLNRYGFDVTVVEKAPGIRTGGQAVDFKGSTHRTVLTRMGILEQVEAAETPGTGGDGLIVNARGKKIGITPAAFSGGDIEIPRGDLAKLLYDRTAADCQYVFGDTVTSLIDSADGIDVTFEHGAPQTYDLVVGADGIHSNIRRLAFGPESDYVEYLGHYYALVDLDSDLTHADEMYNEPGRMVATGGPKAPAFFVFASEPLDYERSNVQQQKHAVADAFQGSAWKTPQLIAQFPHARDFHLDSISRVSVDRYARGRVVLLGDSAYGNALGGFGTGLAIVGAYVLAGELHRAAGDYRTAYAQYEARYRGYAKVSRKVNAGGLLAPSSRARIWLRNRMFSVAGLLSILVKLMDNFATDIKLEDYEADLVKTVPAAAR